MLISWQLLWRNSWQSGQWMEPLSTSLPSVASPPWASTTPLDIQVVPTLCLPQLPPSTPSHPSSSPPRGPAENKRNRLWAAHHQAVQAARTADLVSAASSENVVVTKWSPALEVSTTNISAITVPVTLSNIQSPTVTSPAVNTVTVPSSGTAPIMST